MTRNEIDLAMNWAAAEGWNPGVYDAACFYAADPEGFLVGELSREPVASISVVKYGNSFGFLGFYIVKPPFRGNGYGLKIWKAGLEQMKGRNIGLDGVVAQQDNYRKSGFKLAYRNIRYEGTGGGPTPDFPDIIPLSPALWDRVLEYDRPLFPENRNTFLQAWLRQPESITLGVLKNGRLAGYGMIRVCRSGYKIGPLFADDPELAERLFISLKSQIPTGSPIYLDVPEVNTAAVFLAEKYEMKVVFETARMYTGSFPDLPFSRLFGVTSFELG